MQRLYFSMKKEPNIAIVGATGLVGSEIVVAIEDLKIPYGAVRLFASKESAGEVYKIGEDESVVEVLNENSFNGIDIAIFAVNPALSEKYIPIAREAGAVCIDNTGRFALQDGIPLVVPEVNLSKLPGDVGIVSCPCSPASQIAPVLHAIEELAGIKRVVLSTYQSVSGAGKDALDELWEQTLAIFNQTEIEKEAFQHQIAFNCIPQIDLVNDEGDSKEEVRIVQETRKVLGLPELKISVTAVRVPVLYAHAESVNVETVKELTPSQLINKLSTIEGLRVYPESSEYPMQLSSVGTDAVHVGRLRKDTSVEHGLNMWVVADNVRKGAALNSVLILKHLIEMGANC